MKKKSPCWKEKSDNFDWNLVKRKQAFWEFWKRKQAQLQYDWDVADLEFEEVCILFSVGQLAVDWLVYVLACYVT